MSNFQPGADFDDDGDVDGDDLARWHIGFGLGSFATHMLGDADADEDVDGGDFLAWQRQLGQPAPAAATVPEPGHFVIGGFAFLAIAASQRPKSQK